MDHGCYVVCFQDGRTVIRFRCSGEIRYLIFCHVYNNNNILYEYVAQRGSGDGEKAASVSGYTYTFIKANQRRSISTANSPMD